MRNDFKLAPNVCGFESARSIDERCLFEAELVALSATAHEPNASPGQYRILKTGLSTIVDSPAGPND